MTCLSVFIIFALSACGSTASTGSKKSSSNGSSGGGKKGTLVFADAGWDSIRVHNDIARVILEKGYGYKTDVISGSSAATIEGLQRGDIDIYMEVWTANYKKMYDKALNSGNVKQLRINYDDDKQGFYVPTYVIKGDPKRGIKAVAPELKTVNDLKKYSKVFKDPSDPSKGRITGAPTVWTGVDSILHTKMKTYGLNKTFNYFSPGSAAALSASLTKAYKEGKPWVGSYWTPTWIMGKYDMTLLKEPAYNKATWKKNKGTVFPSVKVAIAVTKKVIKNDPKVAKFLKQYHTSSELTNEALAYMQNNKAKPMDAAKWWLKKNENLWTKWVPSDVADKVKKSLN